MKINNIKKTKLPLLGIIILLQFISIQSIFSPKKEYTLIIDSLIFKENRRELSYYENVVQSADIFNKYDLTNNPIDYRVKTNSICKLNVENDSSVIYLPLDLFKSRIEIHNLHNLHSDTIQINKLIIYNRLTNINTNCKTEYFYPNQEIYKVIDLKKSNQNSPPVDSLTNYHFTINNKKYDLLPNLKYFEMTQTRISHGTNKKNSRKKNGEYKKGVKKFYSRCQITYKISAVIIEI